jgi:hypothetical protein
MLLLLLSDNLLPESMCGDGHTNTFSIFVYPIVFGQSCRFRKCFAFVSSSAIPAQRVSRERIQIHDSRSAFD